MKTSDRSEYLSVPYQTAVIKTRIAGLNTKRLSAGKHTGVANDCIGKCVLPLYEKPGAAAFP